MAAPRTTQLLALRNLARQPGAPRQQIRNLHMTGPATYASPVLTQERSILNLPRDIAGLRAECKRWHIDATGGEHELIARLNAEHIATHRAFTTLSPSSPRLTTTSSSPAPRRREFNTSRALKAIKDSSTVDFAYMPWSAADHDDSDASNFSAIFPPAGEAMPVPVLPTDLSSSSSVRQPESHVAFTAASATAAVPPVMKPEISTMSADSGAKVSVLAESVDCHALHVDFQRVAEQSVGRNSSAGNDDLSTAKGGVAGEVGVLGQIWRGIADDLSNFGAAAAAARGRKLDFAY